LFEVFWFSSARLDLRLVHELDVGLLPVVGLGTDSGNVEAGAPLRDSKCR
jgi:hypothetical protein